MTTYAAQLGCVAAAGALFYLRSSRPSKSSLTTATATTTASASPRLLAVGLVCCDIVNEVEAYPEEDGACRAVGQAVVRGGNASNTLTVCAQLGLDCSLIATVAAAAPGSEVAGAAFLAADMARCSIDASRCVAVDAPVPPTSYITSSRLTGSRTIVHYNTLRELKAEEVVGSGAFGKELRWSWIHFEGRNAAETATMMAAAADSGAAVSVELEKNRPGLRDLLPLADVVFLSREWAEVNGHADAGSCLRQIAGLPGVRPRARLICAWGKDGAYGLDMSEKGPGQRRVYHQKAFPPPRVVDTIGAGDTFNAAVINALARGRTFRDALDDGCRIAGEKVGRKGFAGLGGLKA
eukprot:g3794.t1